MDVLDLGLKPETLNLIRMVLEFLGALLMLVGGSKYALAKKLVDVLILAIDQVDHKETKQAVRIVSKIYDVQDHVDGILDSKGLLNRTKNGTKTSTA